MPWAPPAVARSTGNAINELIIEGANKGWTEKYLIRRIRDILPLDPRRRTALRNYRKSLEDQGLPRAVVTRRSEQYRQVLLTERARTIARTENAKLATDDLHESVKDGTVLRWVAKADACVMCKALHGQKRTVNVNYGDIIGPPAHPNCRCKEVRDRPRKDTLYKAHDGDNDQRVNDGTKYERPKGPGDTPKLAVPKKPKKKKADAKHTKKPKKKPPNKEAKEKLANAAKKKAFYAEKKKAKDAAVARYLDRRSKPSKMLPPLDIDETNKPLVEYVQVLAQHNEAFGPLPHIGASLPAGKAVKDGDNKYAVPMFADAPRTTGSPLLDSIIVTNEARSRSSMRLAHDRAIATGMMRRKATSSVDEWLQLPPETRRRDVEEAVAELRKVVRVQRSADDTTPIPHVNAFKHLDLPSDPNSGHELSRFFFSIGEDEAKRQAMTRTGYNLAEIVKSNPDVRQALDGLWTLLADAQLNNHQRFGGDNTLMGMTPNTSHLVDIDDLRLVNKLADYLVSIKKDGKHTDASLWMQAMIVSGRSGDISAYLRKVVQANDDLELDADMDPTYVFMTSLDGEDGYEIKSMILVDKFLAAWANSSSSNQSKLLQRAIKELTEANMATAHLFVEGKGADENDAHYDTFRPLYLALAQVMYDATQSQLRDLGYEDGDSIQLVRYINVTPEVVRRGAIKRQGESSAASMSKPEILEKLAKLDEDMSVVWDKLVEAKNAVANAEGTEAKFIATNKYAKLQKRISELRVEISMLEEMAHGSDLYMGPIKVNLQPLSSFSTTPQGTFGDQGIFAEIPIERIFSIPSTGLGCLNENEVVVIGDSDDDIAEGSS